MTDLNELHPPLGSSGTLVRVRGLGKVLVDSRVNDIATHVSVHQGCYCCGWDSDILFTSWVEVDGKKIYSDPPAHTIGVNSFCVDPYVGWGTRLQDRGVPLRLIEMAEETMLGQLKNYLANDPDTDMVERAQELLVSIPRIKFEPESPPPPCIVRPLSRLVTKP